MPIDAVKIPQNVYIEDRIVGPLTLKQILIVGIGGGFSYALWAMLSKAYGAIPVPLAIMVWTPAVISAAFAFIKINDLSMLHLLLLTLERMNKPQIRTWSPRRGVSVNIRTYAAPDQHEAKPVVVAKRPQRLDELSSALDQELPETPIEPAVQAAPLPDLDEEPVTISSPEEPAIARPVNPDRVRVSPLADNAATSLFRDISPARYHG